MAISINRIGQTRDLLGESPFWDDAGGCLCWMDSVAGIVRRLDIATGVMQNWQVPAPVGSIAPASRHSMIVALKSDFVLLDLSTGATSSVGSTGIDHPNVRLNDGKVDRDGNFVCGTMHSSRQEGETPEGGVFRVSANLAMERIADALGIANGPSFSPDGRTLYISDSAARRLWAYDYDGRTPLGRPRLFADTAELGSGVDGATVDRDGRIWGVLVRAGKIVCFLPDGKIERLIDVPLTHPTSLCFGGAGLDRIFVTSLSRSAHLSADEDHAGGLFVIDGLDATGLPVDRFGADGALVNRGAEPAGNGCAH